MQEELERLEATALAELAQVDTDPKLEEWRVRYLGKKSALTAVLRGLAGLSHEERREFGARANNLKATLQQKYAEAEEALSVTSLAKAASDAAIDVTLPGRAQPVGRVHPITQVITETCAVFARMGFQVIAHPLDPGPQ